MTQRKAQLDTLAVASLIGCCFLWGLNQVAAKAGMLALGFPEATGLRVNALIASGLVLFVITFAVNFAARSIVGRRDRRMA